MIDKLNRNNWSTWEFQMRHFLMAKGLWGAVEGSEVLADDATAAVQAPYHTRLQKSTEKEIQKLKMKMLM